jgi:hypothetical protein
MIDLNELSSVDFPKGAAEAERIIPAAKLAEWIRSNRKPTSIRWAVIDGPLNLEAVNYGHELVLQNCVFRDPIDVSDSRFAKAVDLRGSVFEQGLDFFGSRIDGSLLLNSAEIRRGAAGDDADADFDLLRLQGNLDLEGLKSQVRVGLRGARVGGEIDLTRADITGRLDLQVAVVEGSLIATLLTVRNSPTQTKAPEPPPGEEEGAAVGGDGTANLGGIQVTGQVKLGGAHIAQDLVLFSADIKCGLRCDADRTRRTEVGGHALLGSAKIAFGATFTGARIRGDFKLDDTHIEGALQCSGALVQDPKDPTAERWQRTEVLGMAVLSGSHITGGAYLDGLYARSGLNVYSAELQGGLYCYPFAEHRSEFGRGVFLAAARITVRADFRDALITGDLNLQNASVDGDLSCDGMEISRWSPPAGAGKEGASGHARFGGVRVTGQLNCNGIRIAGDFNLQSADISGGIFCRPRQHRPGPTRDESCTRIDGDLILAAAVVAGGIHLDGAIIGGGLNLESAEIEGGLVCSPWKLESPAAAQSAQAAAAPPENPYVQTRIRGDIEMATARVSGVVDFAGALLKGRLDLSSASLCNGLLCTSSGGYRADVRGPLVLRAANISGAVVLSGVDLHNDLNLEGAEIKSGLNCHSLGQDRTTVTGHVLLAAARVSGVVDLCGLKVTEDVNMEGAVIDGKLSCTSAEKHRTEIGGNAALGGIKVAGAVTFSGAVVGKDLNLRGAAVEGKVLCQHAEIRGSALLGEVKVSGQIDFSGSTVRQDLSLQGAHLDGMLLCRRTHAGGKVDLGGCSVRTAVLDFGGLEDANERRRKRRSRPAIRMEGFQFQELTLGEKKEDGTDYLELLASSENFEVSTYYAVERWLRNQGMDEQANSVYLAMRGERRRAGRMFFLARPIDWLFDIPIWLAMHYKLLFLLFLASLALSTWVFTNPAAVRLRTAAEAGAQPAGAAPADPPALADAFWLSLQMNLPMTHIPAAEKWELTATPVHLGGLNLWLHYDYYGSLVSIFGYLAVPLFLGGVAGTWLRKKAAAD